MDRSTLHRSNLHSLARFTPTRHPKECPSGNFGEGFDIQCGVSGHPYRDSKAVAARTSAAATRVAQVYHTCRAARLEEAKAVEVSVGVSFSVF